MSEPLEVGTEAPDFTLKTGDGDEVTLSSLRGQKVVLNFYPADWSPGCTNQMDEYTREADQLHGTGARVFGVSVDSHWSHKAWQEARGLKIPLLADFHPHGGVARQYGVFNDGPGTANRVTFVIDEQGIIQDVQRAARGEFPSVGAVCAALSRIG